MKDPNQFYRLPMPKGLSAREAEAWKRECVPLVRDGFPESRRADVVAALKLLAVRHPKLDDAADALERFGALDANGKQTHAAREEHKHRAAIEGLTLRLQRMRAPRRRTTETQLPHAEAQLDSLPFSVRTLADAITDPIERMMALRCWWMDCRDPVDDDAWARLLAGLDVLPRLDWATVNDEQLAGLPSLAFDGDVMTYVDDAGEPCPAPVAPRWATPEFSQLYEHFSK